MKTIKIQRGDIWLINFDPTIGDEIKKQRPAIVINRDIPLGLNLNILVPLTTWKEEFSQLNWLIKIESSKNNGLDGISAANCFQVRCVSNDRFKAKIGSIEEEILDEIVNAVAFCIGA